MSRQSAFAPLHNPHAKTKKTLLIRNPHAEKGHWKQQNKRRQTTASCHPSTAALPNEEIVFKEQEEAVACEAMEWAAPTGLIALQGAGDAALLQQIALPAPVPAEKKLVSEPSTDRKGHKKKVSK
jgi:hypothetical protein